MAALLLQLLWLPRTQAQAVQLVLHSELPAPWQRCVTEESLRTRYRASSDDGSSEVIQVALRSLGDSADGVTTLELRAERSGQALGVRVLPVRARDCSALPETLALVLRLLAQRAPEPPPAAADRLPTTRNELPPTAAERTPLPRDTPKTAADRARSANVLPPSAAGPALVSSDTLPPTAAARASDLRRWALGVSLGTYLGTLPSPAVAPQLWIGLRLASVELRLRAALAWPQERALAEGSVTMAAYELVPEVCPVARRGRWGLGLCLGTRLGWVRASSRGFAVDNRTLSELSWYLGLVPELAFALADTTWLQARAGVAIALQRPRFVLEFQDGAAARALEGPAAARGEIAVGITQIF